MPVIKFSELDRAEYQNPSIAKKEAGLPYKQTLLEFPSVTEVWQILGLKISAFYQRIGMVAQFSNKTQWENLNNVVLDYNKIFELPGKTEREQFEWAGQTEVVRAEVHSLGVQQVHELMNEPPLTFVGRLYRGGELIWLDNLPALKKVEAYGLTPTITSTNTTYKTTFNAQIETLIQFPNPLTLKPGESLVLEHLFFAGVPGSLPPEATGITFGKDMEGIERLLFSSSESSITYQPEIVTVGPKQNP